MTKAPSWWKLYTEKEKKQLLYLEKKEGNRKNCVRKADSIATHWVPLTSTISNIPPVTVTGITKQLMDEQSVLRPTNTNKYVLHLKFRKHYYLTNKAEYTYFIL